MAPEAGERDAPREFRLEGVGLAVVGGVLVALLIGAFELGRTVERWSAPARATGSASDPLAGVEPTSDEAPEKLTFFDTLSGGGKEPEPKREAARGTAPSSPEVTAPPPPSAGAWFVQVFVGRDREAAGEVVRTLRGKGYPVRADAVSEGRSGSLYKVRVGGFPSREAAEAQAQKLHDDGQASTWVVRAGG
jgi:cell division septation protein DedD